MATLTSKYATYAEQQEESTMQIFDEQARAAALALWADFRAKRSEVEARLTASLPTSAVVMDPFDLSLPIVTMSEVATEMEQLGYAGAAFKSFSTPSGKVECQRTAVRHGMEGGDAITYYEGQIIVTLY